MFLWVKPGLFFKVAKWAASGNIDEKKRVRAQGHPEIESKRSPPNLGTQINTNSFLGATY